MKIFEWNFQQTFLIRFHEKLIQNGWAWPLFDTYHTHFSKTLLFRKWPLKPNKSWKFKIFFCIFGNHFIGLFNGILHVLIFWVVAEKQKDFDWGYILIWNRLYVMYEAKASSSHYKTPRVEKTIISSPHAESQKKLLRGSHCTFLGNAQILFKKSPHLT